MDRLEVDLAKFLAEPSLAHLPRCPHCQDLIRQHVLWFDEFYDGHADYQWARVQDAAVDADLVVFVGTSFAVGVTELFLHRAFSRGQSTFSIDPSGEVPYPGILQPLAERSEIALPAICDALNV